MDDLIPFSECNKLGRAEHMARYIAKHPERTVTGPEISRVFGVWPDMVYRYAAEGLIKLHRVRKRIPERDELISKGYSLGEMACRLDIAEETIRSYILRTEQYALWRQARKTRNSAIR